MWVVLCAEEAALGIFNLAEVEFYEVPSLELAGGLDSAQTLRARRGRSIFGLADGRYFRVGSLLSGGGAGCYCFGGGGGGGCCGGLELNFFGGDVGFADGFSFQAVGFLDKVVSGGYRYERGLWIYDSPLRLRRQWGSLDIFGSFHGSRRPCRRSSRARHMSYSDGGLILVKKWEDATAPTLHAAGRVAY